MEFLIKGGEFPGAEGRSERIAILGMMTVPHIDAMGAGLHE
jgi:hypothetical protein